MSNLLILILVAIILLVLFYREHKETYLDQLSFTLPDSIRSTRNFQPELLESGFKELNKLDTLGNKNKKNETKEGQQLAKQFKQLIKSTTQQMATGLTNSTMKKMGGLLTNGISGAINAQSNGRIPSVHTDELKGRLRFKINHVDQEEEETTRVTEAGIHQPQPQPQPQPKTQPAVKSNSPSPTPAKGIESKPAKPTAKSIIQTISKENPYFWSGITQINYYEYPSTQLKKSDKPKLEVAQEEEVEEESIPVILEEEEEEETPEPVIDKTQNTFLNIIDPKHGIKGKTNLKLIEKNQWPMIGNLRIKP